MKELTDTKKQKTKTKTAKLERLIDWYYEYQAEIIIFILLVCVFGGIIFMIGMAVHESEQHEAWYNSLSSEEKAAYDAEQQAKYNANVYEYEVLNVYRYMYTETNTYGGTVATYPVYVFSYLSSGTLKEVNHFRHVENGTTKVVIGSTNKYVVDTNPIDDTQTLYLTEETIRNIQTIGN